MMDSKKITRTVLWLSAVMLMPSEADIFHLRDGREIDGEIVSAAGDTYILSYEVSKGVRDEMTVKKKHVTKIEKADQSLAEYEQLKGLLPIDETKDEAYYQKVLDEVIKPFLKTYPKSSKVGKVKEIQKVYQNELEMLQSGAVKLDGEWLTKDKQEANQYEVDAQQAHKQFNQFAQSGDFVEALAVLKKLEEDFMQTKAFRSAAESAIQFLPIYQARLNRLAADVDTQIENRKTTIERAPVSDRLRIEQMLKAEEDRYQQQLAQATSSRATFLPVNRFHKDAITKNLKMIDREIVRLKSTLEKSTMDAGEAYRTALSALNQKDLDAAKAPLQVFRSSRAPKHYMTPLNDLFKKVQKEHKEKLAKERQEAAEKAREARNNKGKEPAKKESGEVEKKVFGTLEEKTGFNKKLEQIDAAKKAAEQ